MIKTQPIKLSTPSKVIFDTLSLVVTLYHPPPPPSLFYPHFILKISETKQVVAGQDTRGHFTSDLLSNTGEWLHTSNDSVPLQLREPTDRGYICLFKKV